MLGAALNVAAVVALQVVPHTYRPGDVAAWLAETQAHPSASIISSWAFTIGLVSLAAFAFGLARSVRSTAVTVGAAFFGFGALLDAAGTMAPIAALHVDASVGQGLLWMTLLLDSAFNGLLGLGLLCFAWGLRDWPRWLRVLGVVAGLSSLPVALQFHADAYARLLMISGPLWLAWVLAACVQLLRSDRA